MPTRVPVCVSWYMPPGLHCARVKIDRRLLSLEGSRCLSARAEATAARPDDRAGADVVQSSVSCSCARRRRSTRPAAGFGTTCTGSTGTGPPTGCAEPRRWLVICVRSWRHAQGPLQPQSGLPRRRGATLKLLVDYVLSGPLESSLWALTAIWAGTGVLRLG
jgi:hypothetical protein